MMGETGDFKFEPKELKIKAGTKVRFINMNGVHSATAYPDKIPAGATAFDTTLLTAAYTAGAECTAANGCYEVEFTTPGVYEYKCIPHEALGMVGKIEVE
jgi:plastocyanin